MSPPLRDVERSCRQCGDAFVFTAEEQRWYAERDFAPPSHCPTCRAARRAARPEDPAAFPDEPAQQVEVVCAACGAPTTVAFEPSATRPVYCDACFRNR